MQNLINSLTKLMPVVSVEITEGNPQPCVQADVWRKVMGLVDKISTQDYLSYYGMVEGLNMGTVDGVLYLQIDSALEVTKNFQKPTLNQSAVRTYLEQMVANYQHVAG